MPLFRKEVIEHQRSRLSGQVLLLQPMSIALIVCIVSLILVLVVSFLFNAQYTRKATVRGYLMPSKGVIKSYAEQGGVIENIWVKEGSQVQKGERLFTLSIPNFSKAGDDIHEVTQAQLNDQKRLLNADLLQYENLLERERQHQSERIQFYTKEQVSLLQQLALSEQKITLIKSQSDKLRELTDQQFVSNNVLENHQRDLLDAEHQRHSVNQKLLVLDNQRKQFQFDSARNISNYELQINALLRQLSELENNAMTSDTHHQYSILASHSGTVTAIQAAIGQHLSAGNRQPLLNILPEESELIAYLMLPTRTAGFVKQDQVARLRFDAFPYQRFGFIESRITRVDRAVLSPQEIQAPLTLHEPVYRVKARVTQDHIEANGRAFQLKNGLMFDADIMLETRTLIEWIVEPLFGMRTTLG